MRLSVRNGRCTVFGACMHRDIVRVCLHSRKNAQDTLTHFSNTAQVYQQGLVVSRTIEARETPPRHSCIDEGAALSTRILPSKTPDETKTFQSGASINRLVASIGTRSIPRRKNK